MSPEDSTQPERARASLRSRLAAVLRYERTVPLATLSLAQRRHYARMVILAGGFGMAFVYGSGGAPLVGMFRQLGASPFWIGVLAAIPQLANLMQPVGSMIVARTGSRKRTFLRAANTGRAAWFVIIAAAYFLPPEIAVVTLLALVLFTRMCESVAAPAWYSWVSDLVPENEQGSFWGAKEMWGRIVGTTASVALNYYLGNSPPFGRFLVFFALVATFGLVDTFIHRGVSGVVLKVDEDKRSLRDVFLEPLRDRTFLPLILFSVFFAFSCNLGGGMFALMLIEEIDLSYVEIALYVSGLLGVASIVSARLWGRLVDNLREGPRLVFSLCCAVIASLALIWPVTAPRQHSLIALNVALGGIGWSGWGVALMALIAGLSKQENRASYMAMHSVAFGLGSVIGSITGGQLAEYLEVLAPGWQPFGLWGMAIPTLEWGPVKLTQLRVIYLLTGISRTLSLLLLLFIRPPESLPMGVYVKRLFSLNPFERGTYVYIRQKFAPPGANDTATPADDASDR